ncbi:MAG TPA: excinuclease ABC subunit UvrC [Bacteroidia bacterium]|nr:excinuclease ABC subunit UvrC [Bacteroidia bacterium]
MPVRIETILKTLPEKPGVYQYFDAEEKILYVGKAKNLKKRVSSYFHKEHDNSRLRLLVKKITDIKTIVVNTEYDALLLENNLIKQYQPRYNISLKDDKTYPWICLKRENYPRIFYTRKKIKDGSEYFGPYASITSVKTLLAFIKENFPLRTCSLDLTEKNIAAKKFRACLDYHIGTCKAPCISLQTQSDYDENIKQIKNIIKGNISSVIRELKQQMNSHSEKMEFENAQLVKEKIESLEKYQAKSMVVSNTIEDLDVAAMVKENDVYYVTYFHVVKGAIIASQTVEVKKKLDESDSDILLYALYDMRTETQSTSKEIVVSFYPESEFPDVKFFVPKAGDKKILLDLCARNAEQYRIDKNRQLALTNPEEHAQRILQQMKKDLRMKVEPVRIDCFDNSNIQGHHAVSAMTVFINAKPAKKEYRHFNVKTVEGPDDFATMEEVIFRRYSRVLEEKNGMPQLIVIDGGKGQLSAACTSLQKLGLLGKVAIIGIAKRLEEIYYPGDSIPMYLDKRSETLRIIQQIRDEAHRFGITHHRKKRNKSTITTELNQIKGISDVTAQKLLSEFKSVKKIKETSLEEIEKIAGKAKAKLVYDYFKSTN